VNFHEAKEIAARYGANQPSFPAGDPRAAAWVERIARLPLMDDAELAEAVAEANLFS
jgi:hypothetical protein